MLARRSLSARFWNYVIAGILITAPVSITLWLSWKMVTFVDARFRPLIPPDLNPESYLPFGLPGAGIVGVLVALTLIGMVTTGYLGKWIIRATAMLLAQIPVVSSVYGWTRQVLETVLSEESSAFREVVLIEYPCRGTWAVGFISGRTEGEVQQLTQETVYNVFIPATPNPTTGFLLFIPERDIQRLDISVEDGIKLVISGGIVKPPRQTNGNGKGRNGKGRNGEGRNGEGRNGKPKSRPAIGENARVPEALVAGTDQVLQEAKPAAKPVTLMGRLRNYFLTGTLVTAPVAITIWLAWQIIEYFDAQVMPLVPAKYNPENYLPFSLPGLGLVVALLALFVIGLLTAGFLGRTFVNISESILDTLPVVRGLYSALKQILETIFKDKSNAFREVVLIEYPRPDSWAIGFITGAVADEVRAGTPNDAVNIFLPTTPNPTSGFLLFVPRSRVRRLRMSVEEGLKMVVSGGIVTPEAAPAEGTRGVSRNGTKRRRRA